MNKYVIGIYFNISLSHVVLILKNRPGWQKGKFNFPGGHIENFDKDCMEAITREFKEECGLTTEKNEWKYIGLIENKNNYILHILTSIEKEEHGFLQSLTDEKVSWHYIDRLPDNTISNLSWLIPFAKNYHQQGNADDLKFGYFEYYYK